MEYYKIMTTPKVSIIIPVYNCERYLKKCLDSLLKQTLKDIEIICINDGSTDNSIKILQKYADKDARILIIDQENKGVSAARNAGVEKAAGEFIGFVDSDDWVNLTFYEKLYNAAQKYDADIAVGGITRVHKFYKHFYLKYKQEISTDDYKEKLRICDVPDRCYMANKLYRKEMLKLHNLKFEESRLYEDIMLTPQVLYYAKKLVAVPGAYYYYRRYAGSIVSLKTSKAMEDLNWAKKEAREFIESHGVMFDDLKTNTERFKLLGLSVFKIETKGSKKTYRLFNIIKWHN